MPDESEHACEDETIECLPNKRHDDQLVAEYINEQDVKIGALSHRGMHRLENEDQYFVLRRSRHGTLLASSVKDGTFPDSKEETYLLSVADGMGGHVSGEVASATAMRAIWNVAIGSSSWIMRPTGDLRAEIAERVERYSDAIQKALQQQAKSDPELAGMGTTLTAAYLMGEYAVVANVGDSRSYLIHSNEIHQITRDHTVAQELMNERRPSEVALPFRNVLTRCFNTRATSVEMETFALELSAGDYLLLCTDGLTNMVTDDQILEIVLSSKSVKGACEELVRTALENGGEDNVTVLLTCR